MSEKDVLILAIESSCDETAASVVKNGRTILSNVISSQIALHTLYGGVVPEIASRKHIEKINQVVEEALAEADVTLEDLDAVGVEHRDHDDREQVIDDGEGEQERPQGFRQAPPEDRQHRQRERNIRSRGDRPPVQGIGIAGGEDHHGEQDRRGRHPSHRREHRDGGLARVAQAPGNDLVLQLDTDDEEEHGQQTIRCPRRHIQIQVQCFGAECETR